MKPFKLIIVTVMLLMLAGCATYTVPSDKAARIKKVGVISLTALEFHRKYTGLTVFGNEREQKDISSWNVDDEYEDQMLRALSSLGLFEAVRVPYERKELYTVYKNGGQRLSAIEPKLKAIAEMNSLDTVVVATSVLTGDFLAGTNQYLQGAGFYATGVAKLTATSAIHLVSNITVIDGWSGKPIAERMITPTLKVPPELSRAKFSEPGGQKDEEVRKMLVDLPGDKWGPAFIGLFANVRK
ncbi:MAG: hypothetical protein AAGU11_02010 [Syntrophobacteraceae bacterium]